MWGLYVNGKLHNTFEKQGDAWLYAIDNGLTEIRRGKSALKKNVQLVHPKDHEEIQNARQAKANVGG